MIGVHCAGVMHGPGYRHAPQWAARVSAAATNIANKPITPESVYRFIPHPAPLVFINVV
jgi:hypothetical protein